MRNLFKEVWKSFKKSKIMIIGLTLLIFLSTAISTMFLDVMNTYNSNYNEMKNQSVLHDFTIEGDSIQLYGSKPKNAYSSKNIYNPNAISSVWEYDQTNINNNLNVYIPDVESITIKDNTYKDLKLIDAHKLGLSNTPDSVFLNTSDVSTFINNNLSEIKKINPINGNVIIPDNLVKSYSFTKYNKNGTPNSHIFDINAPLSLGKYLFRTIKLSDIVDSVKDEQNQEIPNKISIKNPLILDKSNKIFLLSRNNSTNTEQGHLLISQDQVASLLGFDISENPGIYVFNKNKKSIFDYGNTIGQDFIWKLSEQVNAPFVLGSTLNINNTFEKSPTQKIATNFNLDIKIDPNWIIQTKTTEIFTRTYSELNYNFSNKTDPVNNNWTGYYKEYLENVDQTMINSFQKTSFWKKELDIKYLNFYSQAVIPNNKQKILQVDLKPEDLSKNLILKNGTSPTSGNIINIEDEAGIFKNNNISITKAKENLLKIISNENIISDKLSLIDSQATESKYNDIYNFIEKEVGKHNIGYRQTTTISSISESNENNFYHLINTGNQNNEIKWNGINVQQNVGKIQTQNVLNDPLNNPEYDFKGEIPSHIVAKIIKELSTSLSLDREYINPMVTFETININRNGIDEVLSNAKIIWLSGKSSANNIQNLYGVFSTPSLEDETKRDFFIYKKNGWSGNKKDYETTPWESQNIGNSYNDIEKYIINNNLEFASFDLNGKYIDVIGEQGWAKQKTKYADEYSIAFQQYIPSSKIVDAYNEGKGFELFMENLKNSISLELAPLMSPLDLSNILDAVNEGFSWFGFGDALVPPAKLYQSQIEAIAIGSLAMAGKDPNTNTLNNLLTSILSNIKYQANNSHNPNSYFEKELSSLFSSIKILIGIDLSSFVSLIGKDPLLLDYLIELINSIDIDRFMVDLFDELYSLTFSKDENNKEIYNFAPNPNRKPNQVIGTGDYLPLIFKNIKNWDNFKIQIGNIVDIVVPNIWPTISWSIPSSATIVANSLESKKTLRRIDHMGNDSINGKYYINSINTKDLVNALSPTIGTIIPIPENSFLDSFVLPTKEYPLELDMDLNWFLKNYIFLDPVFNINFGSFMQNSINSFVEVRNEDNLIVLNEKASMYAVVNEAFLRDNGKEVYTPSARFDPFTMNFQDFNQWLNQLDSKYTISISEGVKYLIVGTDLTIDYLQPVINSENIQVNTKNQALMYVNQLGFDRAMRSNSNSPVENYFLVKSPKNASTTDIASKINRYFYYTITGKQLSNLSDYQDQNINIYKKAYLISEDNPFYPERKLRTSTYSDLMSLLEKINIIISIFLILLITIVLMFVIKRYISSKSKVLGILKAQGYSSMKIAISICLFAIIVSIIGGFFGYVVGHFSVLGIFDLLSIYWTMPIALPSINVLTICANIFLPILGMSLLIILMTIWYLKKSSIKLMNGLLDINDSKSAKYVRKINKNTSIKNRFSVALSLSSVSKLIALFLSIVVTSTVIMFSIATKDVFAKSITKSYNNKKYKYTLDLKTPTSEGGNLSAFDPSANYDNISEEIFNSLYVPIGDVVEGQTYVNDYFKPGPSSIINKDNANGNPGPNTPHIFTKASIDLTVLAGGTTLNVWDTLLSALPESQKAGIIRISQDASSWLEWTQGLTNYNAVEIPTDPSTWEQKNIPMLDAQGNIMIDENGDIIYKTFINQITGIEQRVLAPYFNYVKNNSRPEESHFTYKVPTIDGTKYAEYNIVIGQKITEDDDSNGRNTRDSYRSFLVNAYSSMYKYNSLSNDELFNHLSETYAYKIDDFISTMPEFVLDYFITTGAISLNTKNRLETNNADETYTYAIFNSINNKNTEKIYGYKYNSPQISILDSSGRDLLKLINDDFNSQISQNIDQKLSYIPIIVNDVVAEYYNIGVGSIFEANIQNKVNRQQTKILNILNSDKVPEMESYKFKIIGISDTRINEEWITTQKVTNYLLESKYIENSNLFNGIISSQEKPFQATDTLGLYSSSGYWAADKEIMTFDNINNATEIEKNRLENTYIQIFAKYNNPLDPTENNSTFANNMRIIFPDASNKEIDQKIIKILTKEGVSVPGSLMELSQNFAETNKALIWFNNIYSNNILEPIFSTLVSFDIEKGFVENLSSSIEDMLLIALSVSLSLSLILLIMITTMILNDNEKNIALFSILGYSTKQRMAMFFSIYVPIVMVAILFSIPLAIGALSIFGSFVLTSSFISLSLGLSIWNVLISSLVIILVFGATCSIAWLTIGRINPNILLKG